MKTLKYIVKQSFKTFGLNISKIPPHPKPPPVWLYHNIEILFDVGANVGQFALIQRAEGYKGKIVSFEPLPEAYTKILDLSKNDPNWIINERCAVGSDIGECEINIAGNSESSSILPMLDAHLSAAPSSIYIGKSKTKIITLDSVINKYSFSNENIFLKIDTQGFEDQVLKGILKNLKRIRVIQLELSIVPLYNGQEIYKYFFDFFDKNNFILWSVMPGFYNNKTGQHLQFDAIFVNKKYIDF